MDHWIIMIKEDLHGNTISQEKGGQLGSKVLAEWAADALTKESQPGVRYKYMTKEDFENEQGENNKKFSAGIEYDDGGY